ncbi:MAG: MlrC C-terminal domain-containing protein, partial [Rhodospirillaceae bacterium]
DVPICCELDLHCHISWGFVDNVTAFVIFKEYPHIDFADRAEEVWTLMEGTLEGRIRPAVSVFDCRMVGQFHTTRQPMQGFVQRMRDAEGHGGVLSVSLGHGFPWANVPHTGARVVVITDADKPAGDALVAQLGGELWAIRDDITPPFIELDDAIDRALATDGGPVVFADIADNPGGGAAGDSTFIAQALIERGVTNCAVGGIWDPVAVDICRGAGVGAELGLRLGGKAGPWSGQPLDLNVTVKQVLENHVTRGMGNTARRLGDTVTVTAGGIDYVIHKVRSQNLNPAFFADAGIDYAAKKILVVKSMQHFYADYSKVTDRIHYVSTPGVVDHEITRLPIERVARPVWPLDADPWTGGADRAW